MRAHGSLWISQGSGPSPDTKSSSSPRAAHVKTLPQRILELDGTHNDISTTHHSLKFMATILSHWKKKRRKGFPSKIINNRVFFTSPCTPQIQFRTN